MLRLSALSLILLIPVIAMAQTPASRSAVGGPANLVCTLVLEDAFQLQFTQCDRHSGSLATGQRGAAAGASEIEIIEYRNGDSRISRMSLGIGGQVRNGVSLVAMQAAPAASTGQPLYSDNSVGGNNPLYESRLLLSYNNSGGVEAVDDWARPTSRGASNPPVTIDMVYSDGARLQTTFAGCVRIIDTRPDDVMRPRSDTQRLLQCDSVTVSGSGSAAALARFIGPDQSGARPAARMGRAGSASLSNPQVQRWMLEYDPRAAQSSVRWTLEVRVNRVEMM
jgi:hypothetical protein